MAGIGRARRAGFAALLACFILLYVNGAWADLVTVRFAQGLVHGFLVLQTIDGQNIADGELTQIVKGERTTGRLIFHFKDGSLYDETFVFTQRGTFRLLSEHMIQKGPSFKHPTDLSVNAATGQVAVRYTDDDGKEKVINDQMKLPPDLANGMVPILLANYPANAPQMTVSMLAATPKPRLVKLIISPAGEDPFSVGAASHKATRYVVKIDLRGVAGVVAPIIGRQPPDTSVWIFGGDAPVFLKSEGPMFEDGPIWRIATTSATWPRIESAPSKAGAR
jgi:hypothetical protein